MSSTAARRRNAALALASTKVRRLATTAERERIGRDPRPARPIMLSLITLKLELARKLAIAIPVAAALRKLDAWRATRWRRCAARSPASVPPTLPPNFRLGEIDAGTRRCSWTTMRRRTNCRRRRSSAGCRWITARSGDQHRPACAGSAARIEFVREAKTVQLCIGDGSPRRRACDGNVRPACATACARSAARSAWTRRVAAAPACWARMPLAQREPESRRCAVPDAADAAGNAGARA